jgi:hypothetical protein
MRSWVITVGLIVIIALAIAAVSGSFSGSSSSKSVGRALVAPAPKRAVTATLSFTPTKHARGAFGTLTVQPASRGRLKLTIKLSVPRRTYGVALWSNRGKWTGLYAGYRGQNIQVLKMTATRLFSRPLLVVGQELVRHRVVRKTVGGQVVRLRKASVSYRHLLRLRTGKILNTILAPAD